MYVKYNEDSTEYLISVLFDVYMNTNDSESPILLCTNTVFSTFLVCSLGNISKILCQFIALIARDEKQSMAISFVIL